MPNFKTMPYRARKRLVKAVTSRANGWDAKFDKARYNVFCQRKDIKTLFLSMANNAPWGGQLDLSFLSSDEKNLILVRADEACRHEFDLLGSGPVNLGEEIDWHTDFKSNYRWDSQQHYTGIRWAGLAPGIDIKVPWELSRCLHFSSLGLASNITGDRKYYDEFKAQVRHWIEKNPYPYGVNWACAMDVAMRAVNWINAAMLFQSRIEQDEDHAFFEDLSEALWLAGVHVRRNLEWNGPKSTGAGNHLLADLTGLFGVGVLFEGVSQGAKWRDYAQNVLEQEMLAQVNDDGTNFESSTYYHRMVHEMFQWVDSVADRSGRPFSDGYKKRLQQMRNFVGAYTSPAGSGSQFGDNDSGRLISTGAGDASDHRYLYTEKSKGGAADHHLLMGNKEYAVSNGGDSFPDGGYYFGRQDSGWMGVRAGQILHCGGHAHCDQLSFVLSVDENDFIVDRGTGIYTPDPDLRNYFRETSSHNTIQVNNWEQCEFGRGRTQVFGMENSTRSDVIEWEQGAKETVFEGCHYGFEMKRPSMRVGRRFCLKSNGLEIDDRICGLLKNDEIVWYFHLAPQVTSRIKNRSALLSAEGKQMKLIWGEELSGELMNVKHSPAYGVVEDAEVIVLRHRSETEGERAFMICFDW